MLSIAFDKRPRSAATLGGMAIRNGVQMTKPGYKQTLAVMTAAFTLVALPAAPASAAGAPAANKPSGLLGGPPLKIYERKILRATDHVQTWQSKRSLRW